MWASDEERLAQWRSETISHDDHLYEEWCYEQHLSELWAEEGWLRAAENAGEYDPHEEYLWTIDPQINGGWR